MEDARLMIPPHNTDAEMAVLGSMMVHREATARAMELLRREDFYMPIHGQVFDMLCYLFDNEIPIDLISMKDELADRGQLDLVQVEYLMTLLNVVPTASRVGEYAKMVTEKSRMRRLIEAGRDIVALGFENATADDSYGRAVETLLGISPERAAEFQHIRDAAQEVYADIARVVEDGKPMAGLRTGISHLDHMTSGLHPGLILIAARPSQGKTALLLQIAKLNNAPIAMFSLETSAKAIVRRLITSKTEIDSYQIRTGRMSDDEFMEIATVMNDVYCMDLYIQDRPMEIGRLCAAAKRAVLQYGVKAIMVDYIQLVRTSGKPDSREREVALVTRRLKELSQELKLPIIAAAQLSRQTERREGKLPELQDLRESGELEAACDVAILIHNPKPEGDDDGGKRPAVLYVAKQKDGPTGAIPVVWHGSKLTFHSQEAEQEDHEPHWSGG